MTKLVLKTTALVMILALCAAAQNIPSGARLTVRLTSELSSATARPGQAWEGTLAKDVVVNGNTVARAGVPVRGTVAAATPSGRMHKPGTLSLRVTKVGSAILKTSAYSRKGESHTKSNVTKVGGGAAAGAIIGAIAGGGKGAAIGSLAGGAAGTGVAAATGKKDVVLPAESVVSFTVTSGTAAKRR
jgi:hypothetical protein